MKILKHVYPEEIGCYAKQPACEVFMDDLADYKRTHHRKNHVQDFPEGILDVIEADYPSQYFLMLEDRTRITTLFSNEEWIDILTKSRNSYRSQNQRMNLTRKNSAQGN